MKRREPEDLFEDFFDSFMVVVKWGLSGILALLMCFAVIAYVVWRAM